MQLLLCAQQPEHVCLSWNRQATPAPLIQMLFSLWLLNSQSWKFYCCCHSHQETQSFTEPRDADDLFAGPESISPDAIVAGLQRLKI